MSDEDEYDSVANRQKAAQARVHTDLTQTCRERLAHLTANPMRVGVSNLDGRGAIPDALIGQAINRTYEDVGYSKLEEHVQEPVSEEQKNQMRLSQSPEAVRKTTDNPDKNEGKRLSTHKQIIKNAERDTVLAYIEHLLEVCLERGNPYWEDTVVRERAVHFGERIASTVEKINIALETEGVLWRLEADGQAVHFQPIGSELMVEADDELSTIAQGKKWRSVISPYNAAFELYLERTYGHEVPEKLYNSIEEVARTICVDLEGWEDNREQNLSVYLDRMRKEGLFEPNNITFAELEDLTSSMERAFQKAGAERTNRHKEMDREYCTLMLHQVSAYLTFIIRRYESEFGDEGAVDE